jgi:hypothetical protein
MEWLQNFAQEGYALLTTLGLNLGSIIVFLVAWLRNKIQNVDKNTLYKEIQNAKAETEIRLKKEYDEKFDKYQAEVLGHLQSLENKVLGKIDQHENERKEEIEKQTLELDATIEAVKKKASIDEILA